MDHEEPEKEESWKWIKGYEKRYTIDKEGVVRSYLGSKNGVKIKPVVSANNSKVISLSNKFGKKKMHIIKNLVRDAFMEGYKEGFYVEHINKDVSDASLSNLRYKRRNPHPSKYGIQLELFP